MRHRVAVLVAVMVGLSGGPAVAGEPRRLGGRQDVVDALLVLVGEDGSRPDVWFVEPGDERAFRFQLEGAVDAVGQPIARVVDGPDQASAPCRVALGRAADLTWEATLLGSCGRRDAPEAPPERTALVPVHEVGGGVALGNRGVGLVAFGGGGVRLDRLVDLDLVGRVWAAGEAWPDQRVAGGLDGIVRAGDGTGYVALGAGVAGLAERRTLCDVCTPEDRPLRVGPSLSGAVGVSPADRGLFLELGARSLQDRAFQAWLVIGVGGTRR